MIDSTLTIPTSVLKIHPSAIGVIPPFLRFPDEIRASNVPEDVNGFLSDLHDFVNNFAHAGEYHRPDHFQDVLERFFTDLELLASQYPTEFHSHHFFLAQAFAIGHDCVHNGYGKKQPPFEMTITDIAKLYGFENPSSDLLQKIKDSINHGILEDNAMTNGSRDLVRSLDEPIDLSEEEMSAIVVDAIGYKNGLDVTTRFELSGMIQATEFKRSTKEGKPDFKWPRTQIELLAKLADLGNFCQSVDQWLEVSNRVNIEVPWFTGTQPMDFVNEELYFINNIVKPILDSANQPLLVDVNGDPIYGEDGQPIPVRVPGTYKLAIEEKETFVHRMRDEIESHRISVSEGKPPTQVSEELAKFIESIQGCLIKNLPDRTLDRN